MSAGWLVACRVATRNAAAVRELVLDEVADPALPLPAPHRLRVESPSSAPRSSQKTFVLSVSVLTERTFASRGMRIDVAAAREPGRAGRCGGAASSCRPGAAAGRGAAGSTARAGTACIPAQSPIDAERPGGHLLQADDVGAAGGDQLDHLAQVVARVPAATLLPRLRFQVRTSTGLYCRDACTS